MSGWNVVKELAGLADQLELDADLQGELAVSGDHQEGLAAFREKRRPMFRGFEAPHAASARS